MVTRAFTLVELLVVVTILVVLLALLAPALDRAIYQAELAVCGAQLRSTSSGAVAYTSDNKRRFPYRAAVDYPEGNYYPQHITLPFGNHNNNTQGFTGFDDRPLLRPYMPISALLCPLAPAKVDLDYDTPDPLGRVDIMVFTSYAIWFGWRYEGRGGVLKLGDRLPWGTDSYPVLIGDWVANSSFTQRITSHTDSNEYMVPFVRNAEKWNDQSAQADTTLSYWIRALPGTGSVGRFDYNYAFNDLSVRRYTSVHWDVTNPARDGAFDRVGYYHGSTGTGSYVAVPNR